MITGKSVLYALFAILPASVCVAPHFWQTNSNGNDIPIYNLDNFELAGHLEVGNNPHGITTPRDNSFVLVSIENRAHIRGELIWIDPSSLKVTRHMQTCETPEDIAATPDGQWLYVSCYGGHYRVLDTRSGDAVKKIIAGGLKPIMPII